MGRIFILVIALAVLMPSRAIAADGTSVLLEQLERCDPGTIGRTGPRLDILLALADGRSALELADLLRAPRPCVGRTSSYGNGADEIVLVGGVGIVGAKGAILWVDRGYWRIAAVPLGYGPRTAGSSVSDLGREFLIGVDSGGPAGTNGIEVFLIRRSQARQPLGFRPGGELGGPRIRRRGRLHLQGLH